MQGSSKTREQPFKRQLQRGAVKWFLLAALITLQESQATVCVCTCVIGHLAISRHKWHRCFEGQQSPFPPPIPSTCFQARDQRTEPFGAVVDPVLTKSGLHSQSQVKSCQDTIDGLA